MTRLRPNQTLRLLRDGAPAVGTWLQLHSIHATRLLAAQGCFDWMLVDFEHTPVGHDTAAHIFSTISDLTQGRITPLARVATGSIDHIKQALDAGSQGVIVPMIETAADAEAAVRYARFPPLGERGAGGLAPHLGFGVSRPEYIASVNGEILVGVQIETIAGFENVEKILEVPGIDLVLIGPNDLHVSLGLPAKFWSDEPEFRSAVDRVVAACREAAVPVGMVCRDAAAAKDRIEDGFTFLGLGSDAHFMLTLAGQQFGELYDLEEPAETWCNLVRLTTDATNDPAR
ncbi:HpcH/HpaI aldolase family protein [Kribbella deserti]|uniref:HpcH/HpaI aldolase/citrate lyase family protein n=1 Tax=Kribbella deserti TaxID=1926257 RepID=A0ABV6QN17_9ACTN